MYGVGKVSWALGILAAVAILASAPGTGADPATPDVWYVLTTVTENGRQHYFGVGGVIDRIQNPLLIVQQGDRVALTLVNIEETTSDIEIRDLNLRSPMVVGKGAGVTLTFVATTPGEFRYGSRHEELRAVGLEGKFLVTSVLSVRSDAR